jgi:hypothetical protein
VNSNPRCYCFYTALCSLFPPSPLFHLQPPGDPKYDTARVLSDPRSMRKLRIIDGQIDTDLEAEKWSKSVIKQVREPAKSEGKKEVLKNNNTAIEIEMEGKRKKKLSAPLSVSASADMDSRTNSLLRLLDLYKDSNKSKEIKENLLECKLCQKKAVKTNKKKRKCSSKSSSKVTSVSTSRTPDNVKARVRVPKHQC